MATIKFVSLKKHFREISGEWGPAPPTIPNNMLESLKRAKEFGKVEFHQKDGSSLGSFAFYGVESLRSFGSKDALRSLGYTPTTNLPESQPEIFTFDCSIF